MNINIYYGGRGIIEDPTLYVLEKIQNVFSDLRINFTRYNLYEMKNTITTLPQTLKDADGIILAVSLEWLGIGGYMQQFLDACWLYGDKDKISKTYMFPVVISSISGEQEAALTLKNAWEILGGICGQSTCAYVDDAIEFERNKEYLACIEKAAENIYRTISHKISGLPTSSNAIKKNLVKAALELTPQESEQLSKYVSDDIYVKQQKEDIEQLASFFKEKLNEEGTDVELEFIKPFTTCFTPQENFRATYLFVITDRNRSLYIDVDNDNLVVKYDKCDSPDVLAKMKHSVLYDIVEGRMTFQKAFMTGEMTTKGNFKTLRMLDSLFYFEPKKFNKGK